MTTLSKEDIVRWARSAGFSGTHSNVLMADGEDLISLCKLEEFATLARADIVKANKALVAENERLKTIPMKYRRMAFNAELQDENKELRTTLSAAEAREEKLRDALEKNQWGDELDETACGTGNEYCRHCNGSPESGHEKRCSIGEALSQHRDYSALREMIAGVYEKCAKYFDERADWEMFGARVADYIRELAEKAKEEEC